MKTLRFAQFILSLLVLSPAYTFRVEAKPSSLREGLRLYAKGEFDKASQELQKALKNKPGKTDKIKIYKYIGLSLYTLGRQAEASKNFELCFEVSLSCNIEKKEALDESVIPFFRDLKKRFEEKKNAPKPKTRILVKSPVKGAEILIDGILLGNANTSLETRPGTREITIQAKGYKPRRLRIAINKNVENVYEIDMEKNHKGDKKDKKKKGKGPPVLPEEDESVRGLKDPGPDAEKKARERKDDLDLPEDKGPTAAPPPAPPPPPELVREPVSFAHFLPLGVGQFYNGDYLLGTLFMGTQLYAAGVIIVANQDIVEARENQAASLRRAQFDDDITQDDIDVFTSETDSLIKDKQKRINIAAGAAAGTYLFGVLHAVFNRPLILSAPATAGQTEIPSQTVGFHVEPTVDRGLRLRIDWNF